MNKTGKKIALAAPAFYSSFLQYFPYMEIINTEANVEDYDLIVFSGGEDIGPEIYGQEVTYTRGVSKDRDARELFILKRALESPKTKLLGVCRGHQLINAYLGATFIQDIRNELQESHGSSHELQSIVIDSVIGNYFDRVNSLHHQGITTPGSGLEVTSKYGSIIESTESNKIITTQFHPEFMHLSTEFFTFISERWI